MVLNMRFFHYPDPGLAVNSPSLRPARRALCQSRFIDFAKAPVLQCFRRKNWRRKVVHA
jgi:hypothetical protein